MVIELEQLVNSFLSYLRQNNSIPEINSYSEEWLKNQAEEFSLATQQAVKQWGDILQNPLTGKTIEDLFKSVHQKAAGEAYRIRLGAQGGERLARERPGSFRQCESFSPKRIPIIDSKNAADLSFLQHGIRMPLIVDKRLEARGIRGAMTFEQKAQLLQGAPAWIEGNNVLQITAYLFTHGDGKSGYYFICGYYKTYCLTPKDSRERMFAEAILKEINSLGEMASSKFNKNAQLTQAEQEALDLVYNNFTGPEKIADEFSNFAVNFAISLSSLDINNKNNVAELCFKSFQTYIRIHPFLEANYRTFGIVMNAIFSSAGYGFINFHDIELKKAFDTSFGESEPNKELTIQLLSNRLTLKNALSTTGIRLFRTEDLSRALRTSAAEGKHLIIISLLDAHPELIDDFTASQRRTALHWAIDKEQLTCVLELLKRRARYDLSDTNGKTAIELCLSKKNTEMNKILAGYLLEKYAKEDKTAENALLAAAHNGDIEAVKLLVIADLADINAFNPDTGETALHTAVKGGHKEIVALLLEHGADLSIEDKSAHTAIFYTGDNADILSCFNSFLPSEISSVRT